MPMSREQRKALARLAALTRHHPNDQKTVDLARRFKEERLAEYIEVVINTPPRLTQRQRDGLAVLLLKPVPTDFSGGTPLGHTGARRDANQ